MFNWVDGFLDAQRPWAAPLGDFIQRILRAIFGPLRFLKNFLNGTWLGHPLHPALTDVPVGAFVVALVLDIAGGRRGADAAIALGVLGMLAAAVTGWADYTDTDGKARDHATVHTVVMVVALVFYLVSLYLRLSQPLETDRSVPIVLAVIGFLLVVAGAYIGGHLVFALGNMVYRHAFRWWEQEKWVPINITEVPENAPTKARAGGRSVVLVRRGTTIYALHDTCAHAGCSLSEGKLVDDAIECGCHGSRFRLSDGGVLQGPAVYRQPRFEVRQAEGKVEVRLV